MVKQKKLWAISLLSLWAISLVLPLSLPAEEAPQPPAVAPAPAAPAPAPAAAPAPPPKIDKGDTAWMLTSAALVLMMTIPGLFLFYGGLVRGKNALGTIMHS